MITVGPQRRHHRVVDPDIKVAVAAVGLVAVAALVGGLLYISGRPVQASAAPFYAHWLPHVGPGTPLAVVVAFLVVWRGPTIAARLSWRVLQGVAYAAAVLWTMGLALVDGWQRGLAGRLTTGPEYLHEVPQVSGVSVMVREFSGRILDFQPDSWTTHVAGHPPGALLVFVGLDRLGLGGGGWAALACVLVGSLAAVAVPETVRLLSGSADAGRAVVPFAVLFPGAVWVGVSADGLFAGVTAVGVMLLARRRLLPSLAGGVLLAFGVFLSYGLVLLAPVALVALFAGKRDGAGVLPRMGMAVAGAAIVVAAFTAAGFWWLDGYHLVVERYYQGLASVRPYAYWVWANLAALVACAGPAAAVMLRRALVNRSLDVTRLLPLAAAVAIVAADLSGLSKAETERIWLPFAIWFAAGAALLPEGNRRAWLAVQAGTALLVNHLLLTSW